MKVRVISELEFADSLPEEVKREIGRVAAIVPCSDWLSRYAEACLHLHSEGVMDYNVNDLFKLAEQWIVSGRVKEGRDLQWATSNLWWATDMNGLVSMLQYVADAYRDSGKKKEAKHLAWLSDNIPWGKRKIITQQDLANLASKLESQGKVEEAKTLRRSVKDFPYPKNPIRVATLNMPYHRSHGESHVENPSVLLVMLLEGKG